MKTTENINPAFKVEFERVLEEIRKNMYNLTYSDLHELGKFTQLKEYHI
jgi:hypothetical protein